MICIGHLKTGTGSAKVQTSVHFAVELIVIDIECVRLKEDISYTQI